MSDIFSDYLHVRAGADYSPAPWASRHRTEKQAAIDEILQKLQDIDFCNVDLQFETAERLQAFLALIGCSSHQVVLGNDIFAEFQAWLVAGGRHA